MNVGQIRYLTAVLLVAIATAARGVRLRQASEQYFTSFQQRAQRLRHTIGRPQQAQVFCGRPALRMPFIGQSAFAPARAGPPLAILQPGKARIRQ